MSDALHIGLLTPALSGITGFDSGIGAHFRHLADALTTAGHRVTVLLGSEKALPAPSGLPFAVQIVHVRPSASARLLGRLHWQLHQWTCLRAAICQAARAARHIEVDLWETTSTNSLAHGFLALRTRAPVVTRVSTTAAQLRTTNSGSTRWVTRQIEQWERTTVLRSDRVITHSASHRTALAAEFGLATENIAIIPHGIPVPPSLPARTTNPPHCQLLYVGRLEHRKGIDLLLAALPATLRAAPHAVVTLVGADRDGHWEKHWLNTAPPDIRHRVHFAGLVDAATLAAHYRDADLFVAPSRYESFGLIFVEAMAHALPVVALRAPGAVDLIEDDVTGSLSLPEDTAALSAALTSLALDPARRQRLGTAARLVVETRYSLPALAATSAAFYRTTLSRR